jgi:hypothetical protein
MKLRMTIATGHFPEAKENGSSSPTSPRPQPIVATEGGGDNLRALQRAVVVALLFSRAKYMDIQNALNTSTQHVHGRVGRGRDGSNTTHGGVARGRKTRIQRKGSNPFFADAGAAALTRNTSPWYVHPRVRVNAATPNVYVQFCVVIWQSMFLWLIWILLPPHFYQVLPHSSVLAYPRVS